MEKNKYMFGSGKKHCKNDYSHIIPGYKNNKLTVISEPFYVEKRKYIRCVCDCGIQKDVNFEAFYRGSSKSCGCLRHSTPWNKTHGLTKTPLYHLRGGIISRCENPDDKNFHSYGGRGITICESWRNDFIAFRDWALEHGYKKGLQIERVNVNGNYCPENCIWASVKEQARNKRNTKLLNGLTYGEVLEKYYPSYTVEMFRKFSARIKYGWTIEEAVDGLLNEKQVIRRRNVSSPYT